MNRYDWMDTIAGLLGAYGSGMLSPQPQAPASGEDQPRGLLDNPQSRMGLMLMGQNSPSFGRNVANAAMMNQHYMAQQPERELGAMRLQQEKRRLADEERLRDLAPRFARPGVTPLTPNDDEGNRMPSSPPSFDMEGYAQGVMGIDPARGFELQQRIAQANAKAQPKYHVVNGALVPEPAPGQQARPVYEAPRDQWETLGRDPQTGQMIQQNARTGERRAVGMKPSQTSVTLPPAQKAFEVELAKLDAKQLDEMRDSAMKAQGGLSRLAEMKRLSQEGVYSGWAAQGRSGVANFFNTLGAPMDPRKLQNSQEYLKHAKELTLSVLKEGVGSTNISNADLTFVNETVPQLETNPQARINLLNYMERRLGDSVGRFQAADAHARERGGLGGFNYQPRGRDASEQPLVRNETAIYKAREAIKSGKPRDAVIQRLREQGFDPKGL